MGERQLSRISLGRISANIYSDRSMKALTLVQRPCLGHCVGMPRCLGASSPCFPLHEEFKAAIDYPSAMTDLMYPPPTPLLKHRQAAQDL
jgi:hypothetical protein